MARRYAESDLPPVEKRYGRTLRRANDLGGPTRRECWGARTLDGVWDIERVDDVGTPWQVVHVPTGEQVPDSYGTLNQARHAIAAGYALVPSMLAQAHSANPDHLPEWDSNRRYCPGCEPGGYWRHCVRSRLDFQPIGAR